MKHVLDVRKAPPAHWVGDGFPVRSLFSYDTRNLPVSPFLLLDYAGPATFEAAQRPRGVGEHPHRGFETVTIVYKGEVEHRDSSGGGGIIGPGDVQWMTAGGGIIHEEFHSQAFTEQGGDLEMVQLWVNLPARDKMTPAHYQALLDADIPVVKLADDAGQLRVIAGEFQGHAGAAATYSPVEVWDVRMTGGKQAEFAVPEGHTLLIVVLDGSVQVNGESSVAAAQMATLSPAGESFVLHAESDAKLLVLGGQPLDEPVVGYGPFVMNSREQINEAINDFNSGRFGRA